MLIKEAFKTDYNNAPKLTKCILNYMRLRIYLYIYILFTYAQCGNVDWHVDNDFGCTTILHWFELVMCYWRLCTTKFFNPFKFVMQEDIKQMYAIFMWKINVFSTVM